MADTEDVTGSHSEGAASDYHQLQDHQKIVGEALISLAGVRLVEKVLDLGCGTGHFSVVLSELVGPEGRVVAVDPDVERIKIAKECNTRPNIKFLVENDQTFPGQEYDLVFCNHVIQRVMDKVALFKRLHDKLRSGGSFVFLTFNGTPEFTTDILDAFAEFAGPDFHHKLMYQQQVWETASTYQELADGGRIYSEVNRYETITRGMGEPERTYFVFSWSESWPLRLRRGVFGAVQSEEQSQIISCPSRTTVH